MSIDGYIVLAVIVLVTIALLYDLMRPGLVLFSALVILLCFGIIQSEEILDGFSNKGMITIAILLLVSGGVKQSGALNIVANLFLPKKRYSYPRALASILIPVATLSAFLNNTPVVVIFAPMVKAWANKMHFSSQKFLIPLSYATILGGMCTLIGTSTNLVVHGMMLENNLPGLTMFETGKVGICIAFSGLLYLTLFGNRMLPKKKDSTYTGSVSHKKYYIDATLPPHSVLIDSEVKNGKSSVNKLFKIQSIERKGVTLNCSNSTYTIHKNDKLVITVKSENLAEIIAYRHLNLASTEKLSLNSEMTQIEVVLSSRFPGINETIEDFDFLNHYQAKVLAINRNGEVINTNVGSHKMKAGDSLVLLTNKNFTKNWGSSQVFYLTSFIGEIPPPRYKGQRAIALLLILFMTVGASFSDYLPSFHGQNLDMFFFASVVAVVMVCINILPNRKYTKFITWDVLITIACAFGLSKALQNSGAADVIATTAINFSKSWGPLGVLITIYLITNLFTEVITNNAAAALVFPIALSAAEQLNVSPTPYLITICIAASASFATPIGYQTNLLVQGLGNYKFRDYIKAGLPLNIIALIISTIVIPIIWNF